MMILYVLPVSWLTRPYLIAIEPFRRFILNPAMLRRIQRAWLARHGATAQGGVARTEVLPRHRPHHLRLGRITAAEGGRVSRAMLRGIVTRGGEA